MSENYSGEKCYEDALAGGHGTPPGEKPLFPPPPMTADEFARGYAERSGLTLEQFYALSTVRPCSCDYEDCAGWQALSYESAAEWDNERFWESQGIPAGLAEYRSTIGKLRQVFRGDKQYPMHVHHLSSSFVASQSQPFVSLEVGSEWGLPAWTLPAVLEDGVTLVNLPDRPDITYGNPDPDCKLCLGHGVRPVDVMVEWCECNTWEMAKGPLCTDAADGKPVSLRKTDCSGGCGRYAYLAPLEGMRFTCSTCRPPEMFVYGEPSPAIVPAP